MANPMNLKPLLCVGVLSLLGATTLANAESYEGVLTRPSERARADVAAEARIAARWPVSGEATYAGSAAMPVGQLSRDHVRTATAAATRGGNPHADYAGSGVLTVQKRGLSNDRMRAAPGPTSSGRADQG